MKKQIIRLFLSSLSFIGIFWLVDYSINIIIVLVAMTSFLLTYLSLKSGVFSGIFLYTIFVSLPLISHIQILKEEKGLRYYEELNFNEKDKYVLYALLIFLLWNTIFLIFYYLGNKISIKKIKKIIINEKKTYRFSLILFIFGFCLLLESLGGFRDFFKVVSNRKMLGGFYLIVYLLKFGLIASVVAIRRKKIKKSIVIILVTIFIFAMLGGRGNTFFYILLPFLIYYNFHSNGISLKYIIVIFSLAIVYSQTTLHYRFNGQRKYKTDLKHIVLEQARGKETAAINASLIAKLDNKIIYYKKGSTIKGLFFSFIPRKLWLDKPITDDTGVVGKELMKNKEKKWGLPPQPWGMAYYNFGVIGVVIFSIICGTISGYANKLFLEGKNFYFEIIYVTNYSFFFDIYSTKKIISLLFTILFLVIPIYIINKKWS